MVAHEQSIRILGISFFNGTPAEAVDAISAGGLLVAPSGTCFERLLRDADYRRAITTADIALPDSGLMVLTWRLLRGGKFQRRISGFAHLQELLPRPEFRNPGVALWVLPHGRARDHLLRWAVEQGLPVTSDDCYLAPLYGGVIGDAALLELVNVRRPAHIVIGIGAGPQEKLGRYLRENAAHKPAIHCIGGALGFVTGDQVAIPNWADQLYLGWLFRLFTQPRVFIPRLSKARVLPFLIARYGSELPPLKSNV